MYSLYLIGSGVALIAASSMKALSIAFDQSEDAGVDRLGEKYPFFRKRIALWKNRWSLMETAVSFVCSLLATVSLALLVAGLINHQAGHYHFILLLAVYVTLYHLLISILPRVVAESYADKLSVSFLPLAALLAVLFSPIIWPLTCLQESLMNKMLRRSDHQNRPSSEEEIMSLVEQEGVEDLEQHEREIIRSVFQFGETDVHEIMTPRVKIDSLSDKLTIAECVKRVLELPHSRFPVYHKKLDDVSGVVHVKDLLRIISEGRGDEPLETAVKKVPFVPESMPISKLLALLRAEQQHLAVVVDEYGGTAGVVSLEDIVEELLGEIEDEYDIAVPHIRRMSDGSTLIDADVSVAELNESLGLELPESDEYDSLGGLVFSKLGHVPKKGEIVTCGPYILTVQMATDRQLKQILLKTGTTGAVDAPEKESDKGD